MSRLHLACAHTRLTSGLLQTWMRQPLHVIQSTESTEKHGPAQLLRGTLCAVCGNRAASNPYPTALTKAVPQASLVASTSACADNVSRIATYNDGLRTVGPEGNTESFVTSCPLCGYRPPLPAKSLELSICRDRTGVSVESGLGGGRTGSK